jgi:methanethiol oxidase
MFLAVGRWTGEYGFVGVVVDTTNLEGSVWTWWREGGQFLCEKTAVIPPEPADKDQLPPLLQGFGGAALGYRY